MEAEHFVQATDNAFLRQPESDILVERIRHDLGTELAASPPFLLWDEGGSARQTFITMEFVAGDPSFYAVPHEPDVQNCLARLSMPKHFCRVTFRTTVRARALDGCIGGQSPLWPRSPIRSAHQVSVLFHIDSLTLVVPVSGLVDGIQFREDEYVAFEAMRVFPLHPGRVNDPI